MPPDVWLDRLEVGREGNIQIVGYSYGEEGVFEFNSWLQKSANLRNVALEKANWTRGDRGPVLQFHLVAEFAGQGTEESEENDHD